jgi:cytoplasmic polyadenylation element-binding protein
MLVAAFRKFGMIRVEWPGNDQAASQPKGYVYIIFESEKQVSQNAGKLFQLIVHQSC